MISKDMVVFADYEFLDHNGNKKEGADIHPLYLRVHPSNLNQLIYGIEKTLGLQLKVVYECPE